MTNSSAWACATAPRAVPRQCDRDAPLPSLGATRGVTAALEDAARLAAYPVRSHEAFRRDFPIAPPPRSEGADDGEVLVLIDAAGVVPALLRSTLNALIDQSVRSWRAIVVGSADLAAHPVGSFAYVEPRIGFVTSADVPVVTQQAVVILDAGTILDPQALAWLLYAARQGTGSAVYADHDHGREEWHGGIERSSPAFYWVNDPDFFAATPDPPQVVLARDALVTAIDIRAMLCTYGGVAARRAVLLAADAHGACDPCATASRQPDRSTRDRGARW